MTPAGQVLGLDAGTRDRDSTEHLLRDAVEAVGAVRLACTHLVASPEPHWAVSLEVDGPVDLVRLAALGSVAPPDGTATGPWAAGAHEAAAQRRAGTGRVVVFPGGDELPEVLPVSDVPSRCGVEEVVGVGGTAVEGRLLHTRGHVRPDLVGGRIVLHVRPWLGDDSVAPFEVPDPVACCAHHA